MSSKILPLVITAVLVPFSSWAGITVRSAQSRTVIVQTTSGSFRDGQILIATSEIGEKCELTVTKAKSNFAVVDTSQCSFVGYLKPGQELKVKGGGRASVSMNKKGTLGQWGVDAYYSFADQFTGEGSSLKSIKDESTGSFGLGARYNYPINLAWSLFATLNYEFGRTFSKANSVKDGSNLRYSTSGNFNLIWLEANAAYDIHEFYGFGGINIAIPSVTGRPNAFVGSTGESFSMSPFVGFQLGGGYQWNDQVAVEIAFRAINASASYFGDKIEPYKLWGLMARVSYNLQ